MMQGQSRRALFTDCLLLVALLMTALTLAPALAHVMALPNKIDLAREDYLTVQQIYRGWSLSGVVFILATLSTLLLAMQLRAERTFFLLTLLAFLCLAAALVVFFLFTYPANQATQNWTELPEAWAALRRQWEYSHAVGAGLDLLAFLALLVLVLRRGR